MGEQEHNEPREAWVPKTEATLRAERRCLADGGKCLAVKGGGVAQKVAAKAVRSAAQKTDVECKVD